MNTLDPDGTLEKDEAFNPTVRALMDVTAAYIAYRRAEGDEDMSPSIVAALAAIEAATGALDGWPDENRITVGAIQDLI